MNSLFNLDELRVYRGRDLTLSKNFIVRQPTLHEIEGGDEDEGEGNEKRFFSTVQTLIGTPTDFMAQLDKVGIRYEDISNFQFFRMIFPQLEINDTRLLLGNVDPKGFKSIKLPDERIVLYSEKNDIMIDEVKYAALVNYICCFMQREQTPFKNNGNEFTRMVRMELAYEEMEMAKKAPYKSSLRNMISTMVNLEGFKYNWHTVWDMKIGAFLDSVKRSQAVINSKALLNGCYSGMIDVKKIDKKQLDFMRELA